MYERSEMLNLQDRLHFCREHKEICKRELEKWEFQLKCLPQKRQMEKDDIRRSSLPIILLSVFELIFLIIVFVSLIMCILPFMTGDRGNAGSAIVLLLISLPASYGGIYCFKAWRFVFEKIKMLSRLKEQESFYKIKISNLQNRIGELDAEMFEVTGKLQGQSSQASGVEDQGDQTEQTKVQPSQVQEKGTQEKAIQENPVPSRKVPIGHMRKKQITSDQTNSKKSNRNQEDQSRQNQPSFAPFTEYSLQQNRTQDNSTWKNQTWNSQT